MFNMELLNPYKELVTFWFNNKKYWFGCPKEFDDLIRTKYKNFLDFQVYLNLGVFRKLQTPAAPHPGQALLGAAENGKFLI